MNIDQISVALVAALLVAGCASGGKPAKREPASPPPPPSTGQPATPAAPQPAVPVSAPPVTDTADANWPPETAPGALRRVLVKGGEAITDPGFYFLDVTTGQVEGWQAPDPGARMEFATTTDHRWTVAWSRDTTYLASRENGIVYRWPSARLRLVTTGSGLLLFEETSDFKSTGLLRITDANLKSLRQFSVQPRSTQATQALIAPDGKAVVITRNQGDQQRAYVADVATGVVNPLKAPGDLKDGRFVGVVLEPSSGDLALAVSYIYQVPGAGAEPEEQTLLRRYSWQGEPTNDAELAGRVQGISPDGRLLAWQQTVLDATNATVVQEAATHKPLYRVLGAGAVDWLAGGSGMLLTSEEGFHTVTPAGDLRKLPPLPPTSNYFSFAAPRPSPTDPNLFGAGPAVFDRTGKVRQAAVLGKPDGWLVNTGSWSPSGKEISFTLLPPSGKDYNLGRRLVLPPTVQWPPFFSDYLLQVRVPAGDCLNLRETHTTQGRVLRCLPHGTKMAVGDLTRLGDKVHTPTAYDQDKDWLWVRTAQGEQGWVTLSAGSVDWAEQ